VHRFGVTPDSERPGKFRGGFGVEYELEIRHPSAVVVMRGVAPHDIGKRTIYRAELGEVIRLWGGGGGGFGDPLERDPAAVAVDVAAGLVSPAARARDLYGVSLCDGKVDAAATQGLRTELRQARRRKRAFDFGPAREDWERNHGLAAEQIAEWLPNLPAGVRRYAQAEVYRQLHNTGSGPYGSDAVTAAIAMVSDALGHPIQTLRQAAE
jgi:N-methylhydantoinase B